MSRLVNMVKRMGWGGGAKVCRGGDWRVQRMRWGRVGGKGVWGGGMGVGLSRRRLNGGV